MRSFIGAAVLAFVLGAPPAFAQAAQEPAAPAPAAPVAPAPAQQPAAQAPFPAGARYAFVNIQRIATESAEGQAATARVQALNQQKVNELNAMNQNLLALQQKLEAGANVLSIQAAADLQRQIERAQVDMQRFTEDAQQEVTNLQLQLQEDFEVKLAPVIQQVAQERQLHMLFSVADSGLVWGDPALDLTGEIITRFNASNPGTGAAAAPAQPAPAQPAPAQPAPAPAPANP